MTHTVRDIILLGSTGSIGTQTLDLVARNTDRFRIVGLAAGGANPELLAEQALATGARTVAVAKASAAQDLNLAFYAAAKKRGYSAGEFQIPEILAGPDAATELAARDCDIVLNAIDGAAGLKATLAALDAGRTLALANKESLIIGGDLVARRAKPGQIVPVDSEHSALAQALRGGRAQEVDKLVVTASGGPFRGRTRGRDGGRYARAGAGAPDLEHGPAGHEQLGDAGEQGPGGDRGAPAVRRPLRAHRGGGAPAVDRALDGASSWTAPRSPRPARRTCACRSPWRSAGRDRIPGAAAGHGLDQGLAPGSSSRWTTRRSPRSRLAKQVGATGGTAPAVFNGANEECVAAFLAGRLRFPAIVDTIERVVAEHAGSGRSQGGDLTLEAVLEADSWARARARELTADGQTDR